MKEVRVTIRGNKPLLMNRFGASEETETVSRGKKDYGTPLKQAQLAAYSNKGQIYMPWTWISGSIRHVAGSFKSVLNKKIKSLKGLVGGAIIIKEPELFFNEKISLNDIDVHSAGVVIQRARIMRHRPLLNKWSVTFTMLVDDSFITLEEAEEMLEDAGQRAGVGDFRISKGGPYGTFDVVEFDEIKQVA
jgi:hypothetical protein